MSNKNWIKDIDSVIEHLRSSRATLEPAYVVAQSNNLPVKFLDDGGYTAPACLTGFTVFRTQDEASARYIGVHPNLRVMPINAALDGVINMLEKQLVHYRNARTTMLEIEAWWSQII